MKEIWDLVYESGEDSGVKYDRGSGDPIPKGLCFKVVEIWLRVGERLPLTRRHPSKWAGLKWEVPGGGVLSGESELDAALREFSEEVGIRLSKESVKPLGVTVSPPAVVYSYVSYLDCEPVVVMQPEEVVEYGFLGRDEIVKMSKKLTDGTRERFGKFDDVIFS